MSDDKDKDKDKPTGDDKPKGDDKPPAEPPAEPPKKAADDDPGDSGDAKKLAQQLAQYKKRAAAAESKIDQLESDKLKKSGDLEGLLKKEQEKSSKYLEELKKVKTQTMKHKLTAEFSKHAPDANDVELLSKLDEVKDRVQMDHETLEISGVKEAVNAVRKKRPYLFKQKTRGWGPTPIGNEPGGDKDDTDQYLANMRKAKTSQDKHRVRVQFGRTL